MSFEQDLYNHIHRIERWMEAVEAYLGFDPLALADLELNAAARFDEASQAIHHVE